MPIKFVDQNEGRILFIQITGKLAKADYVYFTPEFERLVQLNGSLRVLFDMAGFEGWEAGAFWQDIKFDLKHFSAIERLAIIGDKKWEHGMALFCKPFTTAKIRYFEQGQTAQAREWLKEPVHAHE